MHDNDRGQERIRRRLSGVDSHRRWDGLREGEIGLSIDDRKKSRSLAERGREPSDGKPSSGRSSTYLPVQIG